MHTLRSILLATAFLGAAGAAGAQESGTAVLEAASERYARLDALCADFEQLLDNPILGESKWSEGRLCQKRPNLFRMDFVDPDGDAVVADGEWFWVFYKSLDPTQVLRFPLDETRGGMDFFREFLSEPAERYTVVREGEEEVDGRATVRLHLTPRAPRGLVSARLWIDPSAHLIRRIEITEDNGLIRLVTLSDLTLDPALAADHFRFTPPPGVDVVTNE